MTLTSFQQDFIKQLTEPGDPESFLTSYIRPCDALQPKQQLAIYQNNLRGALQNTLSQTYSVCCKILGENYFRQLVKNYIATYPSRHFDLNFYGRHFSDFLQNCYATLDEITDFPYLSDLAKLEWLYHRAYYATESTNFDFEMFARLSEPQQSSVYFNLTEGLAFISSEYPIVSIWRLNKQENITQTAIAGLAESCCIYPNQYQVEITQINSRSYQLLNMINHQSSLSEIVEQNLAGLLTDFIQSGWISHFEVHHV